MKKYLWSVFLAAIPLIGFGQDDFGKEVQRKLAQFYTDNLPVKLALFFNQPEYAPGDTVWFKVAFVAANNHQPIAKRQIININIISDAGVNVIHEKVLVTDGFGFSQLIIPTTLQPGVYSFVAYSDWMKNFDPSLFASHELFVSGEKSVRKKTGELNIQPEGGYLVGGVTNKVAVSGSPGATVNITGSNQNVTCTLNEHGNGTILLSPSISDSYRIVEGSRTKELTTVAGKNVAITVEMSADKISALKVKLAFNGQSNSNEVFYLFISGADQVYHASRIVFNTNQYAEVSVDRTQLGGGLFMATLFRENRSVEAERMFFIDRNSGNASIQTDRSAYATRNKVTVEIDVKDHAGNPMKSMLGVTVFNNELFSQNYTGSSKSVVLPAGAPDSHEESVNNWLIRQQWKQFTWSDVLSGAKKNKYKFKNNLHFTGRVINGEKLTEGGVPVASFFLPRNVRIYAEYLKKDGTFDFSLFFDFDNKETVYYTIEKSGAVIKDARMTIESDSIIFSGKQDQYLNTSSPNPYFQFTNASKALDAAYKHGTVDEMKSQQVNPHAFLEEEVFDADVTIDFSKYLIFPTMIETLREIVPSLQHRWKNHQHTVRARIIEPDAIPKGDPIYFIDGVLTGRTDYFMSLKPEHIARIKIIRSQRKLSAFGAIGKNGIVLVETKLLNNAENVPQSLNSFVSTGLTPPFNFNPINVTSPTLLRAPLFRSTLYWNPSIAVGQDGKATLSFYTGDNTGTFTIRADGFAANGEPVTVEKTIEVKFAKPDN